MRLRTSSNTETKANEGTEWEKQMSCDRVYTFVPFVQSVHVSGIKRRRYDIVNRVRWTVVQWNFVCAVILTVRSEDEDAMAVDDSLEHSPPSSIVDLSGGIAKDGQQDLSSAEGESKSEEDTTWWQENWPYLDLWVVCGNFILLVNLTRFKRSPKISTLPMEPTQFDHLFKAQESAVTETAEEIAFTLPLDIRTYYTDSQPDS